MLTIAVKFGLTKKLGTLDYLSFKYSISLQWIFFIKPKSGVFTAKTLGMFSQLNDLLLKCTQLNSQVVLEIEITRLQWNLKVL